MSLYMYTCMSVEWCLGNKLLFNLHAVTTKCLNKSTINDHVYAHTYNHFWMRAEFEYEKKCAPESGTSITVP